MADIKTIQVEFNEIELLIITTALASAQPINRVLEIIQFKLYHRLLRELNELNELK